MSETPRTDAKAFHNYFPGGLRNLSVVSADFARELERELAAARAEDWREIDRLRNENLRLNARLKALADTMEGRAKTMEAKLQRYIAIYMTVGLILGFIFGRGMT